MAEIRFEGVGKRFRDFIVIKNLDLTIKDGEFFTFVGPSGCGKSTILNMIAGLEEVNEGKIYFDDTIVNDLSPRDRDVAMVFQSYALYPHMTVYENMAFPLRMKKMDKGTIEIEVRQTASFLGLGELLHRKPKELSGGQRQRVALGRAIIRKPKVFLMDEPLSNLDAKLRVEMRAELKRLHHELKITTVYVTHDQAEAMSLSERVAVLNQGEIRQCGAPHQVYAQPANLFVAEFMGSPAMNFMEGLVTRRQPFEINCHGLILQGKAGNLTVRDQVIVGIRPEDVSVSDSPIESDGEVIITMIEPAGPFNWVDFVWNRVKVKGTARVEAELRIDHKGFVKFNMEKFLVFDADSGKSHAR